MANEFNIQRATINAFGYVGLPFPNLDLSKNIGAGSGVGKMATGKNVLGKPFFMDVVIDGQRLPNEPLVTITGKKIIVETVVVGSKHKGTVKEFIATGDFNIKIEGLCLDPNKKEYPEAQVRAIAELAERIEALDFDNELAEIFGIRRLVIKDYGFAPMQGKPYSQKYYLSCVSDNDFYANLKLQSL